MNFYTNVSVFRNDLLVRGYKDGKRVKQRIPYKPYLYIPTDKPTDWRSIKGKKLGRVDFDTIKAARDFSNRYKDVENFDIYGMGNFVYTYINDNFNGPIDYDVSKINVINIDIETRSDEGFPNIQTANMEITAICLKNRGQVAVLGCGEFTTDRDDVTYFKCKDEADLLRKFLDLWQKIDCDVVTGWNVEFFDMPYIINRIKKILGDDQAKKISPWNLLEERMVQFSGNEMQTYIPLGISVLDYLQCYRKFTYTQQESYRLDYIGNLEVGEGKIDYSEFSGLQDLYKKDYQKFIEYNIKDVELVEKIDDKMKLLEQIYAIAYDGHVNFADAFTSVRMWDVIIHNYLHDHKIAVPFVKHSKKDRQVEGAYVKDPQVGLHKWVVSFDLNSLYPHLIMQYNISPDTYQDHLYRLYDVDQIIDKAYYNEEIQNKMKDENVAVCASGATYTRDFKGFLPSLMETMYNDRVRWKKKMIELKQQQQKDKSVDLSKKIAQANNMQMAKKIQLNSAYGALGNEYFRWFDVKYAESITLSGQLSIKWMEKKINEYLNKVLDTEEVDYVIAVDTDSLYITLDRLVESVLENPTTKETLEFLDKVASEKLEPFIDKGYEELAKYTNAYEQKMFMKREAIADKGFWTAKKRYALNVLDNEGVRYKDPDLKVMGLEVVRSSTPGVCRESLKEAIRLILQKDNEAFISYIEQFREEFFNMGIEDVAFPRGCRYLDKYRDKDTIYRKGTPIHVRGSLVYNSMLKEYGIEKRYDPINEGDKIKFCYLRLPNPTKGNVIAFPNVCPSKFGLLQYVDYDLQFEKTFLEPLKNITEAIQWKLDRQKTLEDFWS